MMHSTSLLRFVAAGVLPALLLNSGNATAQVPVLASVPTGATCSPRPTGGNADDAHPVCDVRAKITRGPYLHAPTDSSAIITWMTDLPSHVRVAYGVDAQLTNYAYATHDGMVDVGTLHNVRLHGLKPGTKYKYRIEATPVFDIAAYWPTTGVAMQSPVFSFRTFNPRSPTVRFASITDTHESIGRIDTLMQRIRNDSLDFLVQTGDAFNGVSNETQLWEKWLSPIIDGALHQSVPLIVARGNHDTRGPFARDYTKYVPVEENRTYYARDVGPVHLLVLDTGEDKPDSTQVYAALNRFSEFRAEELDWFKHHSATDIRAKSAPFRIIVMHQPTWGAGWISPASDSVRAAWLRAANAAGVDLIIAGHNHRFSFTPAGAQGNNYPVLVVGQDQVAKVQANAREIRVQLIGKDGAVVKAFTLPVRTRK